MTAANATKTDGPAIQPIVEMAQASDKTPDPMTVVMMCAVIDRVVPTSNA